MRSVLQSSTGRGTETWTRMVVVVNGSQAFLLCAYMDDKCPMPRGTLINLSSVIHHSNHHGYFPKLRRVTGVFLSIKQSVSLISLSLFLLVPLCWWGTKLQWESLLLNVVIKLSEYFKEPVSDQCTLFQKIHFTSLLTLVLIPVTLGLCCVWRHIEWSMVLVCSVLWYSSGFSTENPTTWETFQSQTNWDSRSPSI